MLWYVVQVHSGYEKRVKAQLEENIEIAGLKNNFGRILVPTENVVEMKGGQKRKSERKYFPGYVLIEADLSTDAWNLVKSVPRVLTVVGSMGKPIPLSKAEVDRILGFVEGSKSTVEPRLRKSYHVGEVVRVLEGPFNDFTGVIEEVNYEKSRLRVAVSIFGRSTPVELEFSQVEKES
ncbi:transcription termination/antitermination protein NusG [Francisella tularensis subsp. holarctica]|uniref:transcription termination/antitermination protein NusG n=1 Tax=Francisella tularensis TaxID=263 RepID=UPI0005B6B6F7|nr:transcription termination/antitermination protein NusG [Francisella tularensis]KIP31755.1 Transcription antiterminator [Francisella tularensis subsp. holarctica]MCC9172392.1 transcription termination/antitermination protein NusG [Francisella tularensis]BCL53531.1 transcription termination/antitermination protein NusG [Francisella tularensis subsp. holarctica]BCL54615.1 transcription termination/antitermination protein NusG [Francisella tularensis subsp. holarctica]